MYKIRHGAIKVNCEKKKKKPPATTIHRIDHPRAQRPDSLVHSQAPSPHSTTPHRASSPVCQPFTPWFPRHVSKVQGLNHWLQCPSPTWLKPSNNPTFWMDVMQAWGHQDTSLPWWLPRSENPYSCPARASTLMTRTQGLAHPWFPRNSVLSP